MGTIINGREKAKETREQIKTFVTDRIKAGKRVPCLATILIGEDGGSISYMNNQTKLCNELGLIPKNITLNADIEESKVIKLIEELNENSSIDGIIIQLPLPKNLNEKNITSAISYKKDVDCLTDINMGKLYKGEQCFVPCTPQSILQLIKSTGIVISGKNAVIIGRSNIVGKPAAQLLLNENATVTICHSRTVNLKEICSNADILVAAIGRPGFVTREFVKEGSIIIDVGTTMVEGKITGDVNFEEAMEKAAFVTPVPGGVGAMTTTMLMKNTCEAMMRYAY
jgi:methylenetetrahydrofolate dehydrogenase (NADP+)/methenyltetrahydrofolate cyclohydrolase